MYILNLAKSFILLNANENLWRGEIVGCCYQRCAAGKLRLSKLGTWGRIYACLETYTLHIVYYLAH